MLAKEKTSQHDGLRATKTLYTSGLTCNQRTHFAILGVAHIASEAAFLIIRLLFMSPFKSQETLNVN